MSIANSILNNQTITVSGTGIHRDNATSQVVLFWNISGPVTGGSPTIQFTLAEVDPNDETTTNGQSISSSIITSTNVGSIVLNKVNSPTLLVSWIVGGSSPSFGGVSLSSVAKQNSTEIIAVNTSGGPADVTAAQGTPAAVANSWPIKISNGTDTVGISTVLGEKALKVDVVQSVGGGGGGGGTSSNFTSTFPTSGTAAGFNDGTNMQGARVFDADSGAGTQYVLGVNLRGSSSGGSVEIGTASNPVRTDPTGTTAQPITDNSGSLTIDSTQLPAALVGGRIDSNTGAWLGSTAPTVGSKTSANSIPVVIASDQGAIAVSGTVTSNIGTTNGLALDATLTAQSIVDNAGFTDGTTRIVPSGYIFDEVAGTALTENDAAAARIDSKRAQIYVLEDATTRGQRATVTASGALKIDGSAVTQPVSGTVTSNIGTTNGLMLDATFTGRVNTQGQKAMAASTPVVLASDQSAIPVTDNSGSLTIDSTQLPAALVGGRLDSNNGAWLGSTAPTVGQKTMANSIPIALASDQSALPVSQSGTWTVQPGNTANTTPWLITVSQGGNAATVSAGGALKVDNSAVTQPVSGTVTANIGTTNGLALDTTLTSQSMVDNAGFTDGTTRIVPAGFIFDEVAGTALTENDGAAARIDSKRAQVYVLEDATTRGQRATVTASNALKVDGSAVTQPVSGTVTANAGSGTFTVSGTVTSNIGTTNGLMLDSTFTGRINTQGQKTMATSTPVVLSSDQSAIPITDNSGSLTIDSTQLPAALVGGRLDQNIGAWLGSTAPTVGSKTSANSIPVVIASDQGIVATKETRGATGTSTNVASSATNVTLLASNSNRLGATIFNDSTQILFVKLGATASAASFTARLTSNGYYEVPFNYTGIIDGIWANANGSARITEIT